MLVNVHLIILTVTTIFDKKIMKTYKNLQIHKLSVISKIKLYIYSSLMCNYLEFIQKLHFSPHILQSAAILKQCIINNFAHMPDRVYSQTEKHIIIQCDIHQ